ncbi:MAG TPA: N-acetylmuramoyl-L-alanine amidase [Acidimicrobiales bacterium]|nr:N-acetylmuramoyl-L-alanine amidase [Acidimicrobiales bacterium]
MLRLAVAALFLASTLTAALVAGDEGSAPPTLPPEAVTSTVVPSTTTSEPLPPPTVTTVVPAPPPAPVVAKVVVSPSGVVLPVLSRNGDTFQVTTPCGAKATVQGGTPIGGAAVVLDAGHGGKEPGAVGPNGLQEKGLNLNVTNHAKAALEAAGYTVVLTRTADYRMTLEARGRVAAALAPKAFVSIHHNAEPDGPRPQGPGSETYYQVASSDSKRLSGILYEEIVKALSAYPVAWVADTDAGAKYRQNDRGNDYYGILRRTQGIPASLVELAFISNPPEAELLTRPDVQKVEGEAVARGIIRYLTTKDPGSGYVTPYPRNSPASNSTDGTARNCEDPVF